MSVTAAELGQIPMSPDLGATLSRGAEFAAGAGATDVTLEHLLAALCDDHDAIAVLDASNVNVAGLKADVVGQFPQGEPSADSPVSLGVSQDVRRILEAAAAAARGSRRRDINGAIVLAAIVGDGRSMAAQTLQNHGLTFDGAIRALQTALMPQQRPAPQAPPVADDVLARARERVQSRSTPSLRDLMNERPSASSPAPDVARDDESPSSGSARADVSGEDDAAPPPAARSAPYPQSSASSNVPPSHHAGPEPSEQPPFEREARHSPSEPEHDSARDAAPPFSETRHPADGPGLSRPSDASRSAGAPSREMPFSLPSGPSLPFPGRTASPGQQPSGGASQGAPAGSRGPFPIPSDSAPAPSSSPGRPFPGDLPRPRPVGGQPPPIPAPGSSAPPGMRPGAPGSMPGPASLGAPGQLQAEPSLRRTDQTSPGAPAPQQQRLQPAKGKSAARKKGKSAKADQGQLAENIPRSMRVGRTERVEVRIAKSSVKALTEGPEGDGAVWQHQVTITKAMAVRIRAPEGGFFIETASPETQWIENNPGYPNDDFASWRFLITPQSRGWSQLQIIISARTIGADGMAAETALPDQIIEVKVRRNLKRTFARLFGWTVAAIVGGALATFGASGMASVKTLLDNLIR